MEAKQLSQTTREIQRRFFEAIDILVAENRLTGAKKIFSEGNKRAGLKTFCKLYDLNQPRYSRIRTYTRNPEKQQERGYKFIDLDALYFLVKDYRVSAEWLLTGKGKIFK
jgi:hypothetical protein